MLRAIYHESVQRPGFTHRSFFERLINFFVTLTCAKAVQMTLQQEG